MPLNTILKRATSFLGFIGEDESHLNYEDGDIVYCKNNVCVHTPSQYRGEGTSIHHPGYMVVKCHSVTSDHKSLNLSWIPNDRLKRNHDLIYNGMGSGEDLMSINQRNISSKSENESDTYSVSSFTVPDFNKALEKDAENLVEGSPVTHDIKINGEKVSYNLKERSDEEIDSGVATKSSSSLTVATISDDSSQNSPDGEKYSEDRRQDSSSGISSPEDTSSLSAIDPNGNRKVKNFHLAKGSPILEETPEEAVGELKMRDDSPILEDHYIPSSSDSSSEIEKPTEHTETTEGLFGLETSESSFQVETNYSEDEISLDSSTDLQSSPPPRYFSSKARDQWYDRSAESMAISANLAFPESPSTLSSLCPTPVEGGSSPIRRQHKCGIFSVDLGQMKSLRLFFSDKEKTCGQLVIASQESQYKILHFHYGGLDKLANVFEDWNFLVTPSPVGVPVADIESPSDSTLKQFSVCRPEIRQSELHPEEGTVEYLDADSWLTYFSEEGVIEDDLTLRRTIFFGGVEPQLRTNVWPFLLHCYDFRTTFLERQAIIEEKHQLYSRISVARENMTKEEKERFWKAVQCTVEKDVVRTDRSKPCFAGANNPNLEKMKSILLNFAYYNPEIGYTQGMSDILAPILAEIRNEADVFWCFTGMMSKTIFVTSPRDQDMEKNLRYLGELLRMMVPPFYDYVRMQDDGLDLLFCHRWILLCFKREFCEDEALAMWEACWSNYQTDYFHLFLVVAIISIYGSEVWQQRMRPDEMLLYFTSLANHMDGHMVLKKARGLLHQFRSSPRIPCTLVGLCELCGPGMWDSGHAPTVECVGHLNESEPCQTAQSAVPGCSSSDAVEEDKSASSSGGSSSGI